MSILRSRALIALAFVLALVAGACAPTPAAPQPTATSAASLPAATPTTPAAPTPTPTAIPSPTPTRAPTATPTPAPSTAADLNARAKSNNEYSFTNRISAAGQTTTSKGFVKGNKMRFEMNVAGANTVLLLDSQTRQAFALIPSQNTAIRLDFAQALSQMEQPSAGISGVPNDARPVGTEVVDGKQAAVFEGRTDEGPVKYWVWQERGLPLKAQATTSQGVVTVEYLDYQFGTIADNLFELPAGTQIIDMPANIPMPNIPGLPPRN